MTGDVATLGVLVGVLIQEAEVPAAATAAIGAEGLFNCIHVFYCFGQFAR